LCTTYAITHKVYYRVYTVDGAITSSQTPKSSDPSLGRISTILIAPPHTVTSIKRCLCHREGIVNYENARLFITASCRSPMNDADEVPNLNSAGPGVTSREPMALVVTLPDPDRLFYIAKRVRGSPAYDTQSVEPQYRKHFCGGPYTYLLLIHEFLVYYRIYNEDGEIHSMRSFDPLDHPLGRIDAHFVAPPHTAASLKRCISNAERFAYLEDKLFLDISSESPMDDELSISILTNEGPGALANKPMAFVRPAFNQRVQVKHQRICECTMEWSFEIQIHRRLLSF
jgi:hypothetical protein